MGKVDRNKVRKEYEKSFSHVTRHQKQSDRNHQVCTNQNHQVLKLIEIKYERNTKESFSHVTRHQKQSDRNHPVCTNQNHQVLKLIEIKYERNTSRKFLSRYKAPKAKRQESSGLYKPEAPRIKVDRNKVRKEYEQKFLCTLQGTEIKATGIIRSVQTRSTKN